MKRDRMVKAFKRRPLKKIKKGLYLNHSQLLMFNCPQLYIAGLLFAKILYIEIAVTHLLPPYLFKLLVAAREWKWNKIYRAPLL